jgi:hypothetical protein
MCFLSKFLIFTLTTILIFKAILMTNSFFLIFKEGVCAIIEYSAALAADVFPVSLVFDLIGTDA